MKTLVCFSGGLDSLYILWKILTDTTDDVVAFRVNYTDKEKFEANPGTRYWNHSRIEVEQVAADGAVLWLKENVRDFQYTVVIGDATFRNVGDEVVSLAAKWAKENNVDRILYGQEAHHDTPEGGHKHAINRHEIVKKITDIPLEHPLVDWDEAAEFVESL